MKKVLAIHKAPAEHWVGNGFPVRSMFSYQTHGQEINPFLLLDHAGPAYFEKTAQARGVGQHPHRGFETVTIVYNGEVAHRDSTGQGGVIKAGDVQWMTAGAGIIHDEFHSAAFRASGGVLEMVQLWVNLPAEHKLTTPGYQEIKSEQIPVVAMPGGAGRVRVIAGNYADKGGAAATHSPMQVWDIAMHGGAETTFTLPEGWNVMLLLLAGDLKVNNITLQQSQLAILDSEGTAVVLKAGSDTRLLLLSGEPLHEPIVGYGPFVMNTQAQIQQAISDYQNGKFGQI
ncbi:pirin family protein [Alishewanella longhuensis]